MCTWGGEGGGGVREATEEEVILEFLHDGAARQEDGVGGHFCGWEASAEVIGNAVPDASGGRVQGGRRLGSSQSEAASDIGERQALETVGGQLLWREAGVLDGCVGGRSEAVVVKRTLDVKVPLGYGRAEGVGDGIRVERRVVQREEAHLDFLDQNGFFLKLGIS